MVQVDAERERETHSTAASEGKTPSELSTGLHVVHAVYM